jgi:hypothetical protein
MTHVPCRNRVELILERCAIPMLNAWFAQRLVHSMSDDTSDTSSTLLDPAPPDQILLTQLGAASGRTIFARRASDSRWAIQHAQ